MAPDGEAPTWIVRTREGSHLIGVDPAPGAKAQLVREVYARMKHGVEQLAAGEIDAARLPDAAIRHLKNLSEYAERPRKQSVMVRIWVEKKAVALGSDVTQAIVESWGGRLSRITAQSRAGLRQFRITRLSRFACAIPVLRQSIPCYVPEDKLPDAFANFRKRVEVSGLIHYRRNGVPVSIEVDAIAPIPDDAELPSIDDVRGILRTDAYERRAHLLGFCRLPRILSGGERARRIMPWHIGARRGRGRVASSRRRLPSPNASGSGTRRQFRRTEPIPFARFFRRSFLRVRNVTRRTSELAQDLVWDHQIQAKGCYPCCDGDRGEGRYLGDVRRAI